MVRVRGKGWLRFRYLNNNKKIKESISLSFCFCALGCEATKAATLRVFRAKYSSLCPDWLNLLGRLAAWNTLCCKCFMLNFTIAVTE